MEVIESGITIEISDPQRRKAQSPIAVAPSRYLLIGKLAELELTLTLKCPTGPCHCLELTWVTSVTRCSSAMAFD